MLCQSAMTNNGVVATMGRNTTQQQQQPYSSEEQQPIRSSVWKVLRHNTNWKCLILTSLVLGCLSAIAWCRLAEVTKVVVTYTDFQIASTRRTSPCEDGFLYIPIAFVVTLYLVYLVECWHCSTRIDLKHRTDVSNVYQRVQQMRDAQPVVWWKAICYHYVRRSRQVTRYRNGNAYTSTQIYYERIDSHSAGTTFVYAHCGVKDISKKLVGLECYPAIKVRFSKGFAFANVEAAAEFEDQRARFFQDNERRDDYMEMREGLELTNVNFKELVIAFADTDHLPWYVSHPVFWIASFLLVSWPLRVLVESKIAHVHYQVTKLFGVNYVVTSPLTTTLTDNGLATTTSGTNTLEWNIRSNLGLVPSYSEAVLMDNGDHSGTVNDDIHTRMAQHRSNASLETIEDTSRLELKEHRHSWGLFCSASSTRHRVELLGLRPSITRLSLHNGHLLYHPIALWESSNNSTTDIYHRSASNACSHLQKGRRRSVPQNRRLSIDNYLFGSTSGQQDDPPDYDVAIRVSRPMTDLRRSQTDRDIQGQSGTCSEYYLTTYGSFLSDERGRGKGQNPLLFGLNSDETPL